MDPGYKSQLDRLMRSPKVGIIVPAYNEEMNIVDAIDEIETACNGISHEVLVVDDGSRDATYDLASKTTATVIRHPRNAGKGAAVRTAIGAARGKYDVLVIQDADLTIPAKFIPGLVEKVVRGESDVAHASRITGTIESGAMPRYRLVGNKLFALVISVLTRQELHDALSGQKAFDARLLEQIDLQTNGWPDFELIFKVWALGCRTSEMPVSYLPRKGRSKMNIITHGLDFTWQIAKWYFKAIILRRKHRWKLNPIPGVESPSAEIFGGIHVRQRSSIVMRTIYRGQLGAALRLNMGLVPRILEIGSCELVSSLCSYANEVVVIDNHPVKEQVRCIRRIGHHSFHLVSADAMNLPFKESVFDQVIALNVMHRIVNPHNAIQEVWRCLKPNSRFLVGIALNSIVTRISLGLAASHQFESLDGPESVFRAINERFRAVRVSRYPLRFLPRALAFYEAKLFVKQMTCWDRAQ